jgi:transcriptional regulator of arginine metabolism
MRPTSRQDRATRHRRLLDLLESGYAGTQDEIVRELAATGVKATQATVSRDLDDIGAVRRHERGRITYALPERNGPPAGFGQRVFGELVRDVIPSGNLVVIRTFPGMAPTVAAVLDSSHVNGIVGTVAGDDTVLVVADESTGGKKLAKRIAGIGTRS